MSFIEAKLPGSKVLVRGGNIQNARIFVVTMGGWLNRNPDLAERFTAGSAEAAQYARLHVEETGLAASHFPTGIDLPIVQKALKYVTYDGRLTTQIEEAFAIESRNLLEQKKIPSEPKVRDVLVVSLMDSVQKKYPQFFNDLKPLPQARGSGSTWNTEVRHRGS